MSAYISINNILYNTIIRLIFYNRTTRSIYLAQYMSTILSGHGVLNSFLIAELSIQYKHNI